MVNEAVMRKMLENICRKVPVEQGIFFEGQSGILVAGGSIAHMMDNDIEYFVGKIREVIELNGVELNAPVYQSALGSLATLYLNEQGCEVMATSNFSRPVWANYDDAQAYLANLNLLLSNPTKKEDQ